MNKKQKQIIVGLVAISMLSLNFMAIPIKSAQAVDQPTDVSDLLSDSGLNMMATSTITLTTASSTVSGDYWRVTFDSNFSFSGANYDCGYGDASFAASSTGTVLDCTWSGGSEVVSGSSTQIIIGNHINPNTEDIYHLYFDHYASDGRLKERADFMVAIQPHVIMHARVDATLTFDVSSIATTTVITSGVTCDNTSLPDRLDFYTLSAGASTTVCHELAVGTNASDGYIVTVEQDGNMRNAADDEINSFVMSPTGTGSSTQAYTWEPPVAQLDVDYTYGHMGIHSDDADVESASNGIDFGSASQALYMGLSGTDTMLIMHHDGPTGNTTQNTGLASIAYTAEITALQQAGDYENTLTYICTPTY
ncbi:MAG: hypothetical protein U9Q85_00355 [Patescibacteria group bacterium]|nr:hypothetical protein [Patescibacteria group bacterium]